MKKVGITKKMIAAGVAEWRAWENSDDYRESVLVRRIFDAMWRGSPGRIHQDFLDDRSREAVMQGGKVRLG